MPELSRFYGIVIKMYFQQSEHNPPHIHAEYNKYIAEVSILNGEILEGSLPNKAEAMVKEWIGLNKDILLKIWNTQEFIKIKPLE